MSKRRHQHEEQEEHENHERWLITYADMITLLMVLFIVLFSMSQVDLAKYAKFKNGTSAVAGGDSLLEGGTGMLDGIEPLAAERTTTTAVDESPGSPQAWVQAYERDQGSLAETRTALEQALSEAGLEGSTEFRLEPRGLVVVLVNDQLLFEPGDADLRPEGAAVLATLAPRLAQLDNELSIEGHTDDVPLVRGRYATNWELSTARATTVLRTLVEQFGLDPKQLTASGYADQRPVRPNDTPEGRAANRRVEILVHGLVEAPPEAEDPAAGAAEPAAAATAAATGPGEAGATAPPEAGPAATDGHHPTDGAGHVEGDH